MYQRLRTKYKEFHGKYRDSQRRLREESNVLALREELRKKDEKLLASVE